MADLTFDQIAPWLAIAGGALIGSQSGATQAGTSTTTQAPWEPQQPYLQDLFARAYQNLQTNQNGVSPEMQTAFGNMQNSLNGNLSGQAASAISNTLNTNPANYFGIGRTNPYQGQNTAQTNNPYLGMDNPYLQKSIDDASQSAMRNLMPAFNQAQKASGSFGNSGVSDYFGRAAADQLGTIANNAYMNQFNTNSQQTQNQQQFNANLQAGDLARNAGMAQQGITNDINQYNQGQSVLNNAAFNTPSYNSANMGNYGQLFNAASLMNSNQWNPLQQYSSLIRGSYGGSSTSPYYSNPVSGALGGGLLGSQLYSSLFPSGG